MLFDLINRQNQQGPSFVFYFCEESLHLLSPPQFILSGLVDDDALIPRRPASLRPRQGCESPARRDERPFLVLNCLLIQLCTTYTPSKSLIYRTNYLHINQNSIFCLKKFFY